MSKGQFGIGARRACDCASRYPTASAARPEATSASPYIALASRRNIESAALFAKFFSVDNYFSLCPLPP